MSQSEIWFTNYGFCVRTYCTICIYLVNHIKPGERCILLFAFYNYYDSLWLIWWIIYYVCGCLRWLKNMQIFLLSTAVSLRGFNTGYELCMWKSEVIFFIKTALEYSTTRFSYFIQSCCIPTHIIIMCSNCIREKKMSRARLVFRGLPIVARGFECCCNIHRMYLPIFVLDVKIRVQVYSRGI